MIEKFESDADLTAAAWEEIFSAAESVLEDDINENGDYSDEAHTQMLIRAFQIMCAPGSYTYILTSGEMNE